MINALDTFTIETKNLTKRYGSVTALESVDLRFPTGEVTGIIGPNGAGKTTLIGLLGGALTPSSGQILFEGRDISAMPAPNRARLGIGRTYQLPRPFSGLTVRENLLTAFFSREPWVSTKRAIAEVDSILEKCGLTKFSQTLGADLPLLRRKRLEVARALMLKPKLLMLDEVGAGLVEHEIDELIALVNSLKDSTTTIILIEHVIRVVRECCKNLYVLNFGKKFFEGSTETVLASDDVAAVYLGTAHHVLQNERAEIARAPSHQRVQFQRTDPQGHAKDLIMPPLLSLKNIHAGYGQARVLNHLSFDIAAGEVVAVLGANGAGKTTLAKVIAGEIRPTSGEIIFEGQNITRIGTHKRFARGISHCMEGRRIFSELSIEENLKIAIRNQTSAEVDHRIGEVYQLFPVLKERRHAPGTSLSGGQLQMLAIGRALVSKPSLVIFDEISLGLAPVVMDQLYTALSLLRDQGLTMLVVEQDAERVLELADNVHVIQHGQILLSDTAARLSGDGRLRNIYLGNP